MSPRQAGWAVLVAVFGAGLWAFTGRWYIGIVAAVLVAMLAAFVLAGSSQGSSKAHSNPGDQGG